MVAVIGEVYSDTTELTMPSSPIAVKYEILNIVCVMIPCTQTVNNQAC